MVTTIINRDLTIGPGPGRREGPEGTGKETELKTRPGEAQVAGGGGLREVKSFKSLRSDFPGFMTGRTLVKPVVLGVVT